MDVNNDKAQAEKDNAYGYYIGRLIGHAIAGIRGIASIASGLAIITAGASITIGTLGLGTLVVVGGLTFTLGSTLSVAYGGATAILAANRFVDDFDKFVKAASNGSGGAGKSLDDILKGAVENTNKAGVARNFEKSGGYKKTLSDFESLNPTNIKDIQTKYGPGKVGTLSDGSRVIARQGSASGGGATLEVQISNRKVYKIRYGN
jgi:hypothetical protein